MTTNRCPKCGTAMDEGFILDHGHPSHHAASWIEGKPEKSFWSGVRTRGKEKLAITTMRCSRCGFLESFARED